MRQIVAVRDADKLDGRIAMQLALANIYRPFKGLANGRLCSYPDFAKELFKRTIADEDRHPSVYAHLIAFSPIMTQVEPDLVADLAEASADGNPHPRAWTYSPRFRATVTVAPRRRFCYAKYNIALAEAGFNKVNGLANQSRTA
jgi:hypothetical protein